jgi:hypothetical protein
MKERLKTMDLHALLRRLRAGEKDRSVARALDIDRKTVRKYRRWAAAQHLLGADPLPDLAALHALAAATLDQVSPPPQNHSKVEAYRDEIDELLKQGLRPGLIRFARSCVNTPSSPPASRPSGA